jgi:anti-sigma regulatory factor (Ser/Thr protein kinase)
VAYPDTLQLTPTVDAPRQARKWAAAQLGATVQALRDDATLLISELVTNAVTHGDGTVIVTSEQHGVTVTFGVADSSPHVPQLADPTIDSQGGRGLRILDATAGSWGWTKLPDGAGKRVWFRLP